MSWHKISVAYGWLSLKPSWCQAPPVGARRGFCQCTELLQSVIFGKPSWAQCRRGCRQTSPSLWPFYGHVAKADVQLTATLPGHISTENVKGWTGNVRQQFIIYLLSASYSRYVNSRLAKKMGSFRRGAPFRCATCCGHWATRSERRTGEKQSGKKFIALLVLPDSFSLVHLVGFREESGVSEPSSVSILRYRNVQVPTALSSSCLH